MNNAHGTAALAWLLSALIGGVCLGLRGEALAFELPTPGVVFFDPDLGRLDLTVAEHCTPDSELGHCHLLTLAAECGLDLDMVNPPSPFLTRQVQVLRRFRDPGQALVGHVTLSVGGKGGGFYEAASVDSDENDMFPCPLDEVPCDHGKDTVIKLSEAGYHTYQLNHSQPDSSLGRFANAQGLGWRAVACVHALVSRWIANERGPGEVFCSTGNSGGSMEIAYGLAYYGLDAILDAAVMSGGPNTRWDLHAFAGAACRLPGGGMGPVLNPPPGFVADPDASNGLLCWNTGNGCGSVDYFVNESPMLTCKYDPGEEGKGPACIYADCDESPTCPPSNHPECSYVAQVQAPRMNIVPGIADLSYPTTQLRFVAAAEDPSQAQNFAQIYMDTVEDTEDQMQITFIGSPFEKIHSTHVTKAGAKQIISDLLITCPEPSGLLQVVAGLGLLGALYRRRVRLSRVH